jgi:hypothetical protein
MPLGFREKWPEPEISEEWEIPGPAADARTFTSAARDEA